MDRQAHCFQAHIGLWAIEPLWAQQAVAQINAGLWKARPLEATLQAYSERTAEDHRWHFQSAAPGVQRQESQLFSRIDDTALIRIVDQMTKAPASMGGTSTILTRRALRQALADDSISNILLAIDSPGGMVAGTMELADDVAQAAAVKPVAAHIEDLGASAAYWVASQAQRVTATRISQVGSIGVVAEVVDEKAYADKQGFVVHVVSTGDYKGLGAPGTEVTQAYLDEVKALVEGIGREFFGAVQRGRGLSDRALAAVKTGQVWLAPQAVSLGLIDDIESFDEAVTALAAMRKRRSRGAARSESPYTQRVAALRARLDTLEAEG